MMNLKVGRYIFLFITPIRLGYRYYIRKFLSRSLHNNAMR